MIEHQTFQIRDHRGGTLFAQSWKPPGEIEGGIGIVHGLGDHSGRFSETAERFANEGMLVVAHDQVGHGQTLGKRGDVGSFAWFLDDIGCLLKELETRSGDVPQFLYGQSMGGNLVLNYTLSRRHRLTGVVATSPILLPAKAPPAWLTGMARILNQVWPSLSLSNGISATQLSHDADVVAAYENDPLVHDRISARLAVQMLADGHWILECAGDLRTPALVLHGESDSVTSCPASRQFADRAGGLCTLKTWPGMFHELHNESCKQEVADIVCAWMKKQTRQ